MGLPPASEPHVGLQCLTFHGIVVGNFCIAPIGWGKKMCIWSLCDITLHSVKSKVTPKSFGGTSSRVFIEVPLPVGKTKPLLVYLMPNLTKQDFGEQYPITLHDKRTINQWMSFFAFLVVTPQPATAENDELAECF